MGRVTTDYTYANSPIIIGHGKAVTKKVLVLYTSVSEVSGKRILAAGTILGHATESLLTNNAVKASVVNGATSQVIAIETVDCTNGDMFCTVLVEGVANYANVAAVQVPHADALTAFGDRIVMANN